MNDNIRPNYPSYSSMGPAPAPVRATHSEYHEEAAVVGETLHNFTDKIPSDDGTYVKIVTHTERIEKIKQPPTPEEIKQKQEQDKMILKFVGGLVGGFFVYLGCLAWMDSRKAQPSQDEIVVES